MVYRVELWVQPHKNLLQRWCGRRCGPWRFYKVFYAPTWPDILPMAENCTSAGMYHRLLFCIEEGEENSSAAHPAATVEADAWCGRWQPLDHI